MSATALGTVGALVTLQLPGVVQPALSYLGTGTLYFDSGTSKFRVSQDGGPYIDVIGGGGGGTLAATLLLGNTTGGISIVVSTGDGITGSTSLPLAAGAANDLTLNARGSGAIPLNQAGEVNLDVAYTGVGRTSLIGALNALVDGAIIPGTPALAAVLAVGNTTGARDISVNIGQKVVSAAASALTLDGTTTLDLQTGAVTRWQVTAAGNLVPPVAFDNSQDIGGATTNRIRTLYAGTSVVVGATVTINGATNTISSSANLTVNTAAAGTLNLGTTGASIINIGSGAATAIAAAGNLTITGDLTVNGTTTTINTTNLTVTDPLIYANNGGLNPSFAGMAWDQGAALDVIMDWNPTNTRMEFGRFNTVGGTVVPAVALTTLIDVRAANLSLGPTASVTGDTSLGLVATVGSVVVNGSSSVEFQTASVARWNVAVTGDFLASVDNTYDIGAVGPVGPRPRRVYVGTEVVVGNTVTIGAAAVTGSGALGLAATGANVVTVSTASLVRLTAAADGGLGYAGLVADPTVGGVAEGKLYYNSGSLELKLSANGGAYVALATVASVTLQQAYNNGETIVTTTADGAIEFTGSNANNDNVLEISKTPAGAQSGVGLSVSMNANTTGNGITVTQGGSGLAALFSGATISCPGAGASSERFGAGALAAGASGTAVGNGATATALQSTAVGSLASATASNTVAVGVSATVAAGASVAVGVGATVGGTGSTAVGNAATTGTGANSTALGASATTGTGVSSTAVGAGASTGDVANALAVGRGATIATGATGGSIAVGSGATINIGGGGVIIGNSGLSNTSAVIVGRSASVTADDATAVGNNATVLALGGSAFGVNASAAFAGSVALGMGSTTTVANQLMCGSSSVSVTSMVLGSGDTNATPAAVTIRVSDATGGSGAAGSSLTVRAGNGDGAGAGGAATFAGGTSGAGTGGEALIQTGNAALATRVRVLPTGLVGIGAGTPLSTLDVQGSFGNGITSISANTTADTTATVWLVDALAGVITLTLPTAASALRRVYYVKKTDASAPPNVVTVAAAGAETIDGDASQPLVSQFDAIMLISDGTSWYLL